MVSRALGVDPWGIGRIVTDLQGIWGVELVNCVPTMRGIYNCLGFSSDH